MDRASSSTSAGCTRRIQQILVDIEDYNRDDVESTWRLRGWLEGQRAQLIESGEDVPRRSNPQPSDIELVDPELAVLIHRLTADREQVLMAQAEHSADSDLPAPEPSDDQRARWLTADLLQWHRREAKPEWWQYFDRVLRYEDDDFVDDPETIGGLVLEGEVGKVKRSTIWRYRFDPGQDFKLSVGHKVVDPRGCVPRGFGAETTRATPGRSAPSTGATAPSS